MSSASSWPVGNWLLDALSLDEYQRLAVYLRPANVSLGEIVYESGGQMANVFFPITAHVSLLYTMLDGATAEMGLVGNEGVVGISLFMGGDTTPNEAVVQGAGKGLKLDARRMQEEFRRGSEFQLVLLRYTQALMTQISQTAVCNRLHSVEHRLCRWLLMNLDRTQSNKLEMTHDLIAARLGVRREGISVVAKGLQQRGLIKYVRGHIQILDRSGLESCACECYSVVKKEHDRLVSIRVHGRAPRTSDRETERLQL